MMQENLEWGFRVVVFLFKYKSAFQKTQKTDIKKQKTQVGWVLLKNGVFSTLITFQSFCDFSLIARSGTSHVTISLIG